MSGSLSRAPNTLGIVKHQLWNQLPKVSGCNIIQSRDASDAVPAKFRLGALKRGTGGRGSFSGIVATVFGANGFLGGYVCNRLGKIGSQVIVPYRCDTSDIERLRMAGDLGQVLFLPWNLRDEDSIRKVLQYSNVAINLVGTDVQTRNFSYEDTHIDGAARIARIAKECGVEKFIHVSHLNAKKDIQKIYQESEYLKTKYEGELAVREEFPEATIFKTTDMYGENDRYLNYYMGAGRWNPAWPYLNFPLWKKGEQTIKAPVFVSDVAAGIAAVAQGSGMEGKDIECVGSKSYYLNDIVDYLIRILRRQDQMTISNLTLFPRAMAWSRKYNFLSRQPWADLDRFEREHHTDWTNPEKPKLEDLGVTPTSFDVMAYFFVHPWRRHAYYDEEWGEFEDPYYPKPAEFYQESEHKKLKNSSVLV